MTGSYYGGDSSLRTLGSVQSIPWLDTIFVCVSLCVGGLTCVGEQTHTRGGQRTTSGFVLGNFFWVFVCLFVFEIRTLICLELSPSKVGCLSREPEGLLVSVLL